MTCTPREKGGEGGFDPLILPSYTSILFVILACRRTSFPIPFPTSIVVYVSVSHGLGALIIQLMTSADYYLKAEVNMNLSEILGSLKRD